MAAAWCVMRVLADGDELRVYCGRHGVIWGGHDDIAVNHLEDIVQEHLDAYDNDDVGDARGGVLRAVAGAIARFA